MRFRFIRATCSSVLMCTVRGICLWVRVMERCAASEPQPCPLPTERCAIIKNVVLASVSPFCLLRVETHIAPNNFRSVNIFSCCGIPTRLPWSFQKKKKKPFADLSFESNSLPGFIRTHSEGDDAANPTWQYKLSEKHLRWSLHSLLIELVLRFPLAVTVQTFCSCAPSEHSV